MTTLMEFNRPGKQSKRQGRNALARALWTVATCDPADPAPAWELATQQVRQDYVDRAQIMRRELEDLGWTPPPADRPIHWDSLEEIPPDVPFRAVGDPRRVFVRVGELFREQLPDGGGLRCSAERTAAEISTGRGYAEVR